MIVRVMVLSLLMMANGLFAQKSYNQKYSKGRQKGYIILKNGEKVKGELKVKGKIKNQKEILFFDSPDDSRKFGPFEIDGYVFENTKFVNINDSEFRQIIEEGCLNIYIHYYMSYSVGVSTGIPIIIPYRVSETQKKFKDKNITSLFRYSFRKEWSEMLQDNTEIYNKILSKEYKKKHVLGVASKYNENCKN